MIRVNRNFWNGKFADPSAPFNHEQSQLLVDAVRGRRTGLAVDLGKGAGRNALYLAQHGWQTTGVDSSDVAVDQAKKHAVQTGVKLNAVVDTLDHFELGKNRWDLIAQTGRLDARVMLSVSWHRRLSDSTICPTIRAGFSMAYDPSFYNLFLNAATAAPGVFA
jgi:SAM-dependent methyltransferase